MYAHESFSLLPADRAVGFFSCVYFPLGDLCCWKRRSFLDICILPCSPGDVGQEGGSAWSSQGQPSVGCPVLPSSPLLGLSHHSTLWGDRGWEIGGCLAGTGCLVRAWNPGRWLSSLCISIYCLRSFAVSKRECSLSGSSRTRDESRCSCFFPLKWLGLATGHKHSLFFSNSPGGLLSASLSQRTVLPFPLQGFSKGTGETFLFGPNPSRGLYE